MRLLPFPVGRKRQPLDPAPLLQPHYRPSSLVRAGPPRKLALASLHLIVSASASGSGYLASVRSPHGFRHLCFSVKRTFTVSGKRSRSHPSPGSRSSAKELDRVHAPYTPAAARPAPKYPAHLSQRVSPPLVLAALWFIDASSKGLLSLVSPDHTCPQIVSADFDPNAHHHGF